MVPAYSHKVPRVSWYSGSRLVSSLFMYGAFTLSGRLSQNLSIKLAESIPRSEPRHARTPVWPLPISLAATLGITCCFLFLALLRCFSSGGSPYAAMDSLHSTMTLLIVDCSIRTSSDQCLLTTPRSISSFATSFFGS